MDTERLCKLKAELDAYAVVAVAIAMHRTTDAAMYVHDTSYPIGEDADVICDVVRKASQMYSCEREDLEDPRLLVLEILAKEMVAIVESLAYGDTPEKRGKLSKLLIAFDIVAMDFTDCVLNDGNRVFNNIAVEKLGEIGKEAFFAMADDLIESFREEDRKFMERLADASGPGKDGKQDGKDK